MVGRKKGFFGVVLAWWKELGGASIIFAALYDLSRKGDDSAIRFYSRRALDFLGRRAPIWQPLSVMIACLAAIAVARWLAARRTTTLSEIPAPVSILPPANPPEPEAPRLASIGARISSPAAGSHFPVGSTVRVRGTYDRDPGPGEKLVVATSRHGVLYPQQSRLVSTGPREWQCLCDENSPGETMIHVGVGDAGYLARARVYAETGRAGEGWHGFRTDVPPDGANFDQAVTIHIDPA